MKATILTLIFLPLLMACGKTINEGESSLPAQMQLVVVIYDISTSTDEYAMLTGNHLGILHDEIGKNGGGKFYGLHIKTSSTRQDPIFSDIRPLQFMPLKGNAYQQANRERHNKELEVEFDKSKKEFVNMVSGKLILPKDHRYSDIENALPLARGIFENSMYTNYRKRLIIISDMENNHPSKPGRIDAMDPVQFSNDVNLAIVRPSDNVNIDEMMTGVTYTTFVSIDDALNSLFTK